MVDSRDGREYWIARLNDGNCWMLQNLRLGQDTTTLDLTTADSGVENLGFTLNGKLSDGKFTYSKIPGYYMNNSSQYCCTDDYGGYYASDGAKSIGSGGHY